MIQACATHSSLAVTMAPFSVPSSHTHKSTGHYQNLHLIIPHRIAGETEVGLLK